ncbi:DNA-directed RNA polymerase subunit sigma [Bifidobacterium sp. UTBIF-68]|uniref:RNA polymerase subunit sigma n=1 Tax=Bifidobacterium sp. UTBIF-68 TaxID=1465262 RepID=UPI001125BAAE|nr:RNA polymerase subunit sigma [Bifidobacterium sp. UTBIF-68]TPF93608.1 DNA-directed RNA polymerase subunit sigma [Bifidobacterium sp. UTBIF-68]
MRVTERIRGMIVEWHDKGVSPEETAHALRIPVDEVKAIVLQARPAPVQPKRPEFLEPRLPALEDEAHFCDNEQGK